MKLRGTAYRCLDKVSDDLKKGLQNVINEIGTSHKDYELIADPSLKNDLLIKCRPQDVKRSFVAAIKKDFTKEQFEDFVNEVGSNTFCKPRHFDTDTNSLVKKFTDCVYQDIHKAHASFLLDTFKSAPNTLALVQKHLKAGAKSKAAGNIAEAKKHKDFINFAVGLLGQRYKAGKEKGEDIKWIYDISTRSLYNRCVEVTRSKIDKQINYLKKDLLESKELYSNTDGFILQHPDWSKVKQQEEVGQFGTEFLANNEVWFYSVLTTSEQTGYSIHQYFDEDGKKVIVGNLPDSLKEKVDLSKGIVVSYQTKVDQLGYHVPTNVEIIEKEVTNG